MITAVDDTGELYIALLQANSNSSVMELFFTHLIQLLDEKNRRWRQETVILLDGAAYHQSSDIMLFYKEQQLPIMFTGPHSYSGVAIELFFAAFKRADINPRKLPTGKT